MVHVSLVDKKAAKLEKMGDTSVESNTASTNMASSMIIEKDSESCNDMERISENSQTHVLQKK